MLNAGRRDRLLLPLSIFGVLVLAAILRLAWLPQRGLLYWDEAKFALEGIRMHAAVATLFGAHVDILAGKAVGTAKPTHALFIALAYGIAGVHDYVPLMVNAFLSVIGVALTFLIGRRLFDPWTAVLGALLLAVSEYDVIYARSVLSESDANALFLIGTLLWLRSLAPENDRVGTANWFGLYVSAAVMGLAFTCNYRLLIFLAVIVVADLWWSYLRAGWQVAAVRVPIWVVGFVLVPLLWQLVGLLYAAHGIVLFRNELTGAERSYVAEVIYQLHEGKQSVLQFNPVVYLQWWLLRQGWLVSIALLLGVGRAAVQRTAGGLFSVAMILLPYLVFVFAPFTVPRNLVPSLPFASLLAAWALTSLLALTVRTRLPLILAAASLLAVLGGRLSWQLTAERSGFAQAADYVKLHGANRTLTTTEIMVFYLRGAGDRCSAPGLPQTVGDLRADIRAGFHFAVVDRHHHSPIDKLIERVEPRIRRFSALGPILLGESPISSENGDPPTPDARAEYVNLYRLDVLRLPAAGPGHIRLCYRDRVV